MPIGASKYWFPEVEMNERSVVTVVTGALMTINPMVAMINLAADRSSSFVNGPR
ncbi:hypothetical protein BS47DRAFT_1335372 [Hydnum rufescens UP504]|uniref:Uncharacterized protein n=1 Tax=Hydnum rufescens UP504 TaxID=1448309 RepID=A0A9P6E0K7_9AGAM|nr:hypothetical protein BS47DRAFT_1335372 [Hydnum rufescens UP504]